MPSSTHSVLIKQLEYRKESLLIRKLITVKPYIVGEGLQSIIIKKGQVITFDIKYGGEPEPTVKWMKGEEVIIIYYIMVNSSDHKYDF